MLLLYFTARVVQILISAILLAMLIRAILSWFPTSEDSPFFAFVCMITEPFILPVRILLEKLNLFQNTPFDVSFLITWLLLSLIDAIL